MKSLFSKSDKNIGIIGYWFATNYGGVASYYSLYRQVESLGYNPFFVDNPYAATDKEGADVFSRNFFKNEKFNVAPTYDINNLPELNKKTDTFLLGSDQVLTSFSIRAFGKLFLMDFTEPNKRRIAYSSSCGGDNLDSSPELLKYAQNQLKKFNAVSVREYSAVDLLQKKFDIKADVTVDPIFFTSAREYAKLGEKSETVTGENYLLAYVLDPTPDKKKCLEMISEELGLAPKIALDGRKFTHQKNFEKMDMPDATLPELDFYEWLKYYSHASYIFTDSFHGAVISLILNKPCIIYINKGRGYPRFVTLGKMFGIESRMILSAADLTKEKINEHPDFDALNKLMKEAIDQSKKWLLSSLKQPVTIPAVSEEPPLPPVTQDFARCKMLATLLRDYGIKHIVISSGTRHVNLVRFFEANDCFVTHPVVDERSAGFFAIGLAQQLNAPVALCCTSGTSTSNYMSAITEAFYQKIPLIVITADRYPCFLGQEEDQTIPQNGMYANVVKKYVSLPTDNSFLSEWAARRMISETILEATHHGKGPVHINVPIISIERAKPDARLLKLGAPLRHIRRIVAGSNDETAWRDRIGYLKRCKRILLVYGQNNVPMSQTELALFNEFCEMTNCVVVKDHYGNCNYDKAFLYPPIVNGMPQDYFNDNLAPDLIITINGRLMSNNPLTNLLRSTNRKYYHWRIAEDGNISDKYRRLSCVFECTNSYFCKEIIDRLKDWRGDDEYYQNWITASQKFVQKPFEKYSEPYAIERIIQAIPENTTIHVALSNPSRFANRFPLNKNIRVYCNLGTNGIDGSTSTFMGCCAVSKTPCYLLVGDLSFFYDMNSLWNKRLNGNVRIVLFNNFKAGLLADHESEAITYKHHTSAKGWIESLGFKYLSAESSEGLMAAIPTFIEGPSDSPLFLEIFTE